MGKKALSRKTKVTWDELRASKLYAKPMGAAFSAAPQRLHVPLQHWHSRNYCKARFFFLKANSFGLYKQCGSLLSNTHSFVFRSFGPSFPHLDWLVPVSVQGSCGTHARTDSPGPETFQCYHTRHIRRMQSLLIIRHRIGARSESVVCLDYLHLNPHLRRCQVENSETLSSPSFSWRVNQQSCSEQPVFGFFQRAPDAPLLCGVKSKQERWGLTPGFIPMH